MVGCEFCYYGTNHTCNYCLVEKELRNDKEGECTHFKLGLPDYDPNFGCGNCVHNFNDYCKVKHIDVWSYKPSCEDSYKQVVEKACYTCGLHRIEDGCVYCTLGDKFVHSYEVCPNYTTKKKRRRRLG